jgi:hypothetical protein
MARKDEIVAFDVDDLDAVTSSRWPVMVTCSAALAGDPAAIARYQAIPLVPWAPGPGRRKLPAGMQDPGCLFEIGPWGSPGAMQREARASPSPRRPATPIGAY